MRPYDIINRFQLKNPIYEPTASYGHFGRDSYEKEVDTAAGKRTVTFFPWERLDYVDIVKKTFGL
jgi:S-adenosylmethionine synthetase